MQDTDLFQLALGLASPWMVTRSEFDAVDGRLDLCVDFPRGELDPIRGTMGRWV